MLEIFSKISDMQSDKGGFGMARKNPIACFQNLLIRRKLRSRVGPIRMVAQLLITLIETICGFEECDWIRDVNGNRHFQVCAFLPHRVKTRVIHFDQLALSGLLAQV